MSQDATPSRRLPEHPSVEFLKKQAKRLARADGLQLALAQRRLAADYGFRGWADLMAAAKAAARRSPLFAAAALADAALVRRLLAEGADPDGAATDPGTPLWTVSSAGAAAEAKIATAAALLDAGAFLHSDRTGETPLHAAARTGPLAFVEYLIARGAIEWQADRKGRQPWQVAGGPDAAAIAHLLTGR
jgi:ankyrin repeat protein